MDDDDDMDFDPDAPARAPSDPAAPEVDPVLLYAYQWKRRVPLAMASGVALLWVLVLLIVQSQRRLERQAAKFVAEIERRAAVEKTEEPTAGDREQADLVLQAWRDALENTPKLDPYEWALRKFAKDPVKYPLPLATVSRVHAAVADYEGKAAALRALEMPTRGFASLRWRVRNWRGFLRFYEVLLLRLGTLEQIDRHLATQGHVVAMLAQGAGMNDGMTACMAMRRQQLVFLQAVLNTRGQDLEAAYLERWAAWTAWPFADDVDPRLTMRWLTGSAWALRNMNIDLENWGRERRSVLANWRYLTVHPPAMAEGMAALDRMPERIREVLAHGYHPVTAQGPALTDNFAGSWPESCTPAFMEDFLLTEISQHANYFRLVELMRRAALYRLMHDGALPTTVAELGEDVAAWPDLADPDGGTYCVRLNREGWMAYSDGKDEAVYGLGGVYVWNDWTAVLLRPLPARSPGGAGAGAGDAIGAATPSTDRVPKDWP